MTAKTWFAYVLGSAAIAGLLHARPSAQTTGPANPPLVLSSMYGRDLFEFYCATCHGRNGKGGGPAAPALRTLPPDLTTLAARAGGTFPKARVEAFVTGSPAGGPAAHGSSEMPVWGPIFKGLDSNDTMNRIRVSNIVGHIESIQGR